MPETCSTVLKRQTINLRNCCIWLVDSVEWNHLVQFRVQWRVFPKTVINLGFHTNSRTLWATDIFWSIISLHEVRYRASTFALPKSIKHTQIQSLHHLFRRHCANPEGGAARRSSGPYVQRLLQLHTPRFPPKCQERHFKLWFCAQDRWRALVGTVRNFRVP
jgi:hypothetical protein